MFFGKTLPILPDGGSCRPSVADRERLEGAPPNHGGGTEVRKSQDKPGEKPVAEKWTENARILPSLAPKSRVGTQLLRPLCSGFRPKVSSLWEGGGSFKNESNRGSKRKKD